MKAIATYHKTGGGIIEVEYDDEAPCLICGEPIIGASMGGTAICGSCDMGKCRYCGMTIFVMKESVDDGRSKRNLLEHVKWHHEHDTTIPEQTKRVLEVHRKLVAELRAKRSEP
ncbi:MAG: hypothetical protein JRN54_00340 [Nitrososphaerota archaeon]|nr:hypothetical protein [Nitrososphaerota archaeon]